MYTGIASNGDARGSMGTLLAVVAFCLLMLGLAGWLVHCAQADANATALEESRTIMDKAGNND